jgi:hypothetical protein
MLSPASRRTRASSGKERTDVEIGFVEVLLTGGIFVSLVLVGDASAQSASPPDFSGGDWGWVHVVGATFPPMSG